MEDATFEMYDDFVEAFSAMMESVHKNAVNKGFWEPPKELQELQEILLHKATIMHPAAEERALQLIADMATRNDGEAIALMHSELSEMLEAQRKMQGQQSEKIPEFTHEEEEAADLLIRLMDFCAGKGLRLAEAVVAKAAYNKGRPYKHGKKF